MGNIYPFGKKMERCRDRIEGEKNMGRERKIREIKVSSVLLSHDPSMKLL